MSQKASPWIARLIGVGALSAGAWIVSVGLEARTHDVGGPKNDYAPVRAEIVGGIESERNPGYHAAVYEIAGPDGETVRCEGASYSAGRPRVGRTVTLAMLKDAPVSACRISYGSGGISSSWLILAVGGGFALMGAAFVIRPPKTVAFGGYGGAGGA